MEVKAPPPITRLPWVSDNRFSMLVEDEDVDTGEEPVVSFPSLLTIVKEEVVTKTKKKKKKKVTFKATPVAKDVSCVVKQEAAEVAGELPPVMEQRILPLDAGAPESTINVNVVTSNSTESEFVCTAQSLALEQVPVQRLTPAMDTLAGNKNLSRGHSPDEVCLGRPPDRQRGKFDEEKFKKRFKKKFKKDFIGRISELVGDETSAGAGLTGGAGAGLTGAGAGLTGGAGAGMTGAGAGLTGAGAGLTGGAGAGLTGAGAGLTGAGAEKCEEEVVVAPTEVGATPDLARVSPALTCVPAVPRSCKERTKERALSRRKELMATMERALHPPPAAPRTLADKETWSPMMPSVRVKLEELCKEYAEDDGTTKVASLVARLPYLSSWHFAEVIAMSTRAMLVVSPQDGIFPSDFDPVKLFKYMEGSVSIESDVTRYCFEQLVVGGGRFPSLYDGARDRTVNAKNGRRLVVPASTDPWRTKVPRQAKSQKRRHLEKATSEVSEGRCLGPFTESEALKVFESYISVSSFLLSKQQAITSKERLVHNFSDPNWPLNLLLDDDSMWQVQLGHTGKFMAAVRRRAAERKKLHMVTADVSKGYRRLFTRVQDVHHLGLRVDVDFDGVVPFFDGSKVVDKPVKKGDVLYIFDRSLPFGLASSVPSFCCVTTMIKDIVQEKLGEAVDVLVYIDDFVLLGAPAAVAAGIDLLREVLALVGLPENIKKMQIPGCECTYLGVDYDFTNVDAVTATLPEAKKVRYVKHLEWYISKAESDGSLTITRTELQALVGKLAHAAHIFRAGRPFYQRILGVLRGNKRKRVTLDQGVIDDMHWWVKVLSEHSGTVLLNPKERVVRVYTDASTSTGYGVCFQGRYFRGEWNEEIRDLLVDFRLTINELELVALNFALETFGKELSGCTVLFRCDNTSCVYNIESMSSQIPVRAALLRRLFAVASHYGLDIRSSYINTKENLHADTLSRGEMELFFALPQDYPLAEVQNPALGAMDLLVCPKGPADASTPEWFDGNSLEA